MDCWKLTQHVAPQKWSSPSNKIWLWKAIITLFSQLNSVLGKTHETQQEP